MNSTFRTQSQKVTQLFEGLNPKEILVVPIDFAKESHLARICFGNGKYLHKKSFTLRNNADGIAYLLKRIQSACSKYSISKKAVIIGTENPHSYALNFMLQLKENGFIVVEVNASQAKKFRRTDTASNDNLDLDGIANAIINRRLKDLEKRDEIYHSLEKSTRLYQAYVKERSAQKTRIIHIVNILFPGFLEKKKSGIEPFSASSISLMSKSFSIGKIKRMSAKVLTRKLKEHHIHQPDKVATKLKDLATTTLAPPKELEFEYSASLEIAVQLYQAQEQVAHAQLQRCAELLVQTPYFSLLSIPGMGVVYSSVLAAELKDPSTWHSLDQTCAYAGIAPCSQQSGGEDKPATNVGLNRKANRRLKNALLQSAHLIGMNSHPARKHHAKFKEHRLQRHYKEVVTRGGKSGLSTARLLLRIMRPMILSETPYLPNKDQSYQEETTSPEELCAYLGRTFKKMANNLAPFNLRAVKDNRFTAMKKEWQNTFKNLLNIEVTF